MAAESCASQSNETLMLRIVECIALADARGLPITSAHLVTALLSLQQDGEDGQASAILPARELH